MIGEDALLDFVHPRLKRHIYEKFKDYEHEELTACFQELLKFLYLSSKYPALRRNFIPVTQEVDNFWHELILQTAYYQKLCESLPGGEMVHHESMAFSDYKEDRSKKQTVEEILRWIVLYVHNFGDLREDRAKHWFFIRMVMQALDLSLDELNGLARSDTYFTSDATLSSPRI